MDNSTHAELVILNGNIITVNPVNPKAQAVATKFGRIFAVGQDDEVKPLIGADTQVMDAHGRTVIPGFNDAHCHMLWAGRQELQVDCRPSAVSSISNIKEAIAGRARTTPKGEWICTYGYDDTKIPEEEFLTRADIDEVTPDHPVWVRHVSLHMATTNTLGLRLANLTKDSPEPAGGSYGRDPDTGELNGIIYEAAQDTFVSFISDRTPLIPHPTPEQDREAFKLICRRAASMGITSVTDALVDPRMLRSYQVALECGELTVRTNMLFTIDHLDTLLNAGLRSGFGNEMLRLGGVKIFADGAMTARTAYLSEPYVGTKDDYGMMAISTDALNEGVMRAHKAGLQVGIHANGDKCIGLVLDAYEKALQAYPRQNHRHRIEHCTVLNPELLARVKRIGVVVIPFGAFVYYHGEKWIPHYGAKRLAMMFAHRSFIDTGIPIGGSSDHPCAPWPPLMAIQSCVTRKAHTGEVLVPEQRITPEEAIQVYTMGGAYASFEEKIKGSIEVGKLADMVILGEDLTRIEPDRIKDVPVITTIVGGELVYQSESA